MKEKTVTIDDLMAWVDGQLGHAERAAVEAYLAEHPAAREQAEAYREQNLALHRAFDGVLNEPVPERMRIPVRPARRVWLATALAATLAGGVGIGWFGRGVVQTQRPTAAFVHQAAVAHVAYVPEVRHPVEVTAKEEAHLVAWLSKRLGRKVHAPDLTGRGYRLVGGRLLPGDEGRVAAQFMYEDERGQRLTLYIRALASRDRDTAFRYAKDAGIDTFYWIDDHWGYALSGSVGREAMLALADTVYKQLAPS